MEPFSYVNIEQCATIYAHDSDILSPLGIGICEPVENDFVYQISCVIIEHNGSKYVISARKKIIQCKKIELYYCKFGQLIYKNDLRILFQSIETNIVILGTNGYDELRLDLSELIKGNIDNVNYMPFQSPTDIPAITISNKFTMPKSKKKYYAGMIDVNPIDDIVSNNNYEFKYRGSFIMTNTYLPSIYMFEFELTKKKLIENDFRNLYGTFIFDHDKKPIGFITEIMLDARCAVLPIRHVHKIINNFFDETKSGHSTKSLCLPISYIVKKNNKTANIIVDSVYIDTNIDLKSKDRIISIDNKEIIIKGNEAVVFDDEYDDCLPFDVYLRLNLNSYSMMNITIERKNKIISYDFYGVPIDTHMLSLTDQAEFYPTYPIPFINLGGLIIVQFTHELLDILAGNKIKLNSYVIDDFMASDDNKKINHLLIVSNSTKKKKTLNINVSSIGSCNVIDCPVLLKINGTKVNTLTELNNLIKKRNALTISLRSQLDSSEINI